jgi:hypothetical protein
VIGSNLPDQRFEYLAVQIDDVDTTLRVAHAIDRTGTVLQISYRDQPGGIALVPSQGEQWIAVRKGYTWYLDRRIEGSDTVFDGLGPGDMSISAPGTIWINGQPLSAIGGNIVQEEVENASPFAGYTTHVLGYAPISDDNITVYLNGLLLWPSLWTYDEGTQTITFDADYGDIGVLLVRYETAEEVA